MVLGSRGAASGAVEPLESSSLYTTSGPHQEIAASLHRRGESMYQLLGGGVRASLWIGVLVPDPCVRLGGALAAHVSL